MKANFKGRRYKCLVCYDYDLCATCYEAGVTTGRHSTDHPMQCILTRADFGKFDFILQSVRGIPLFYQYTMGLREMNYKFCLIRSISKANNVRMLAAKSVLSQIIPLFFEFCELCRGCTTSIENNLPFRLKTRYIWPSQYWMYFYQLLIMLFLPPVGLDIIIMLQRRTTCLCSYCDGAAHEWCSIGITIVYLRLW